MKFSLVLALLPLALAAPAAEADAAAKQPCCSTCATSYKACRAGCWDQGVFSYCTYNCLGQSANCLDNCKECKA
ncbi:hypothetical protein V8C26DRAFT_432235 [Trichoderma gracile]